MTTRSIVKKIAASLITCSMLVMVPAMAQSTGGSAGDGDKPINPANKTGAASTMDATKDIKGNSTAKTPHPMKKASKMRKEASSAMSSTMSK